MLVEFIFDKLGKTHCVHESFHETGKKTEGFRGCLRILAFSSSNHTNKQANKAI